MIADQMVVAPERAKRGEVVRPALAIAGVALFFTGLDSYAFAIYATPAPSHWVVFFSAAAAISAVVAPRAATRLLASPVSLWAFLYVFVTIAWAVWMSPEPAAQQAIYDRFRSVAFLLAFCVIFHDARARRAAVAAMAVAIVFASLVNVAELARIIEFVPPESAEVQRTAGRAAGLYVNPNEAGMAIVLGLAVVLPELRRAWRIPLLLLAGAGVAATFSRAASLCFAVLLAWLVWRRALSTWLLMACAVAAITVAQREGGVATVLESHGLLNEGTRARIELEQDDNGRLAVARHAWSIFTSAPLTGRGLGATRTWSDEIASHDMYLDLAADHGIIGLALLPALGAALALEGATGFALVLLSTGLFTHNLLENRFVLLAIVLAAAIASAGHRGSRERAP